MEFAISQPGETAVSLARKIGYQPRGVENGEYNLVRPFSRQNYPRFHIYLKKNEEGRFLFNLHLDQKQPSYEGSSAHSGEYSGEIIEKEAERIKKAIEQDGSKIEDTDTW